MGTDGSVITVMMPRSNGFVACRGRRKFILHYIFILNLVNDKIR